MEKEGQGRKDKMWISMWVKVKEEQTEGGKEECKKIR